MTSDAATSPENYSVAARWAKRGLDLLGSSAALLVFAGPMLGIAGLIAISMGRPVLFRQTRIGQGEKPFEILKFRTMRDAVDASGRPLPDAERMTALGQFLRATSLDELPEFLTVLKGDMSLVGPRPLLPEYLPFYTQQESGRHRVKPGITGWAQIKGRNAVSWEERFRLDLWYIDNWSLSLDLSILARTVLTVLKREGISAEGHVTMPRLDEIRAERA